MEVQKIADIQEIDNNLESMSGRQITDSLLIDERLNYVNRAMKIGHMHRTGKYKDMHGTIQQWAESEFGWERREVYVYIDIYKLLTDGLKSVSHRNTFPIPNSIRQCLTIAKQKLSPDELKEVYPMIFGGNKKVSETTIVETVSEWREKRNQSENIEKESGRPEIIVSSTYQPAYKGVLFEEAKPDEFVDVVTEPKPREYYNIEQWSALSELEKSNIREWYNEDSKSVFGAQDNNSIGWAKWSWNPITGCKHECSYCYARDIANRFYEQGFEPSFYPGRLNAPYNANLPGKAASDVSYKNVFTCSMADLFGRWVPVEWIESVLNAVRENPQWNFLFLTKFPKRMAEFDIPDNAWMGTTVDCQARVDAAEKAFENVHCAVKWLSVEPMLEDLKFTRLELFDWVVMGGSSKSNNTPAWAPPFDWVVNLHNQARAAGCMVYQKTNLFSGINGDGWAGRLLEWPGESVSVNSLPTQFKYMKSIK